MRTTRTALITVLRFLRFLRCRLADRRSQGFDVERSLEPEGPGERPAAHRLLKTGRRGVQIRTPTGQRTAKIGDTTILDHHHTQQSVPEETLPAPDTGALRAGWCMAPARH